MNRKYINKCSKDDFLSLIDSQKLNCKVKKIENDEIIFLTNCKIDDDRILSCNRIKYHLKYTVLKHITAIVMILLCTIILLISGSFIRNVKFENNSYYNELVLQDVKSYLIKKGPFYVLSDTPNNISQELRKKYPHYAWIGITVNYSEIIIDIELQDVPSPNPDLTSLPKDLISGYDAVITGMIVKNGVVMVMINQSVKKGDLLVSGNLLIENNGFDKEKLVSANGIIIGKTLCLEKIKVFKKEELLQYTGRKKTIKRAVLFGKDIGKNQVAFDNYYTEIKSLFNFFNIFQLAEVSYYEQAIITTIFDLETSIKFAEKEIYYNFEQKRVSSLESLDDVELFKVEEFSDYFEVSFIVTKHINIVVERFY